jgi:inosose dehydratase
MAIAGIGNAPCSWGVLELGPGGNTPDYERVLNEIAESGYTGTELGDWGFMPTDPEQLKRALEARKLDMLGAFVPIALSDPEALRPGLNTALETARLLTEVAGEKPVIVLSDDNGTDPIRTLNAGRIAPFMQWSPQQWETAAYTANRIALTVHEKTGLRTVFHPHCAGFVETPEEIGFFLEATHPRILGLCLDTAHCAYGGGDPLEQIRHHADRIWHVHFKGYHTEIASECRMRELDYFDAVRRGIFCELQESSIDFATIKFALEGINYTGWIVVEQDVLPGMWQPLESAKNNRAHLRNIGL